MKHFRLLSTKKIDPRISAEARQHGIDIYEKEFITITPLHIDPGTTTNPAGKVVVFTSKNAVRPVVAAYGSAIACEVFCLDGATKNEVARQLPQATIAGVAIDARELAGRILEKNIRDVLFFCGDKRMDTLPAILTQKGVRVTEQVVYSTVAAPAMMEETFDAVAFYSPSAADSFFSANHIPEHVVLFAIGDTTASAIKKHSDNLVITAGYPSPESMLHSVINFTRK